jgi:type II secretory ATPase GspE/PulE/Tfp pilus assembly ATPase PilB-like protein
MKVGKQEVDFRVSMLPTTFGQKIVMRVLDKNNLSVGLSKLGFSKNARPFWKSLFINLTG